MGSTIWYAIQAAALRKVSIRCANLGATSRRYDFTNRSRKRIRKSPHSGEPNSDFNKKNTSPDLLLNLGIPNRSGIFACAIRNFDSIVFAQFLPLPSIGTDLDRTAVIEHPNFHDPLFVIGRPLVFDLLALFRRRDIVLPDYDCFAALLFAAAQNK